MSPTHVSDLSVDVFLRVFDFVRDDRHPWIIHDFSTSRLVCRKWNSVLRPHLFSTLIFHFDAGKPPSEFLSYLRAHADICDYIRRLFLCRRYSPLTDAEYVPSWQDLMDIIDLLARLEGLHIESLWLDDIQPRSSFQVERHRDMEYLVLRDGTSIGAYADVISRFSSIATLYSVNTRVDDTSSGYDFAERVQPLPKHSVRVSRLVSYGLNSSDLLQAFRHLLHPPTLQTAYMDDIWPLRYFPLSSLSGYFDRLPAISSDDLGMYLAKQPVDIHPDQSGVPDFPLLRHVSISLNSCLHDGRGTFLSCNYVEYSEALPTLCLSLPFSVEKVAISFNYWSERDDMDPSSDEYVGKVVDWRGVDNSLERLPHLTCMELIISTWSRGSALPAALTKEQEEWYRTMLPELTNRGVVRFKLGQGLGLSL
ncbi:hypothetical protein K474DRAFT_1712721 [Panus rudis PR-1116 ss-1]|nr:hypothetical protein K474DRAFT_1712721 [Panus rudis PR-1116 ss-1]